VSAEQALKERMARLTELVRDYGRRYHEDDRPAVSDEEYDALVAELQRLEAAHPEWADPESPTRLVGGRPTTGLAAVQFEQPVLSLNNVRSPEELEEFDVRMRQAIGGVPQYVGELKIDGLSVVVTYEAGGLRRAATRGDGATGEDVTENVRAIADVPARLGESIDLEIRGEVYLRKSAFERLNQRREARGETLFANPRNAAAGSLRQLDPGVTRERGLSAFFYEIRRAERLPATQAATLDRLAALGLPVEPHWTFCSDLSALSAFVAGWETARHDLDYVTDGLVVKLNDLEAARRLGSTQKAPRAQVAYKYAAEVGVTRVVGISLSVGRTGTVTPTADLEPVRLQGTTVTRASLHNADILAQLDVRVGDLVEVRKAGEVIPEVVRVLSEVRTGDEQRFVYPGTCPECGTPLVRDPEEVAWRCPNRFLCPAQRREALLHFGSRGAMDIEGLGDKTVDALLSSGLVHTPADLYRLQVDQLTELPRFGPVMADNLVRAIDQSRERPLSRLLASLNIRYVGEKAAQLLARHFGTLARIREASEEELAEVPGVGPVLARSVATFFATPEEASLVDDLLAVGVNVAEPALEGAEGVFAGETVVITGKLARLTREEAQALVERLGGRVASSVSSRTTFLLAGEDAGSKLKRARELGVAVIDEEEFWRRAANGRMS
jgi:DNA ligase (NAD+)